MMRSDLAKKKKGLAGVTRRELSKNQRQKRENKVVVFGKRIIDKEEFFVVWKCMLSKWPREERLHR